MSNHQRNAAAILCAAWNNRGCIADLPKDCRPPDLHAGYLIQDAMVGACGERILGYKIAATSRAGQAHIAVDGPISGRLLESRVLGNGDTAEMSGNRMRVAEAEFVFRFGTDIAHREGPLSWRHVMESVDAMFLGIELPDSRFVNFVAAGAAQLTADNACANLFVLGPEVPHGWQDIDLAHHPVALYVNHRRICSGVGGDALGDPRFALAWLVNHLLEREIPVKKGQVVTTGVCGIPAPIEPGDRVVAEFGEFGDMFVELALGKA